MEVFIIAGLIGMLPAAIARSKGRSFVNWWIYGALLFIVALPHSLLMRSNVKGMDDERRLKAVANARTAPNGSRRLRFVASAPGRSSPPGPIASV